MFKLGIITDEVTQDFARAVEFAAANKLDFVEIRSVWDKPPQDLTIPDIRKMQQLLYEKQLNVISIASPVFKCHIEKEDEYQQHLEFLKHSTDLAQKLNTDILRIFTFWKKETTLDQNWERLLDRFVPAIELAKKENIHLAIENENSCLIGTGKELRRFLDALQRQSEVRSPKTEEESVSLRTKELGLKPDFPVYALWDPCNEIFAGVTEPPYPSGFESLLGSSRDLDRMIHLHVKDAIRENPKDERTKGRKGAGASSRPSEAVIPLPSLPEGGTAKCVPIGDGWIDWQGQFKALAARNYPGGVSLETHWRPKKTLSESMLSCPGGITFSSLGEEASQICLDKIFDILRKTAK